MYYSKHTYITLIPSVYNLNYLNVTLLRSQCMVVVAKRLKVLATCR
jgi:hypothetical protein